VDDGKGDAMRHGNNLDSHKQTAGGHTKTYINSDTPGLWQKHTARNKASEAEQKQSEKQSKRSSQQARAES